MKLTNKNIKFGKNGGCYYNFIFSNLVDTKH